MQMAFGWMAIGVLAAFTVLGIWILHHAFQFVYVRVTPGQVNDDDSVVSNFIELLDEARISMVVYDDGNDMAGSLYNDRPVIDAVRRKLRANPDFQLRSLFPSSVLRSADLRAVGSRRSVLTPERRSRGREPERIVTTEYFVAGEHSSFSRLADRLGHLTSDSAGASQLPAIERVSVPAAEGRVRRMERRAGQVPLELVVHASEHPRDRFILRGLRENLGELDLTLDLDRALFAENLCFLRLRAKNRHMVEIARFAFLRVLREMPKLSLDALPLPRTSRSSSVVSRPSLDSPASCLRVAVLNGGPPAASALSPRHSIPRTDLHAETTHRNDMPASPHREAGNPLDRPVFAIHEPGLGKGDRAGPLRSRSSCFTSVRIPGGDCPSVPVSLPSSVARTWARFPRDAARGPCGCGAR